MLKNKNKNTNVLNSVMKDNLDATIDPGDTSFFFI